MALQAGLPPLDFDGLKGERRIEYFAAIKAGLDRVGEMGSGLHYCNLTEDGDGVKRSKKVTLFAIWESAQADQSQKKWG
jgi:hypothetical protein